MKKPLGMKNDTTVRTSQSNTFGPHQLNENELIITLMQLSDVPVLYRSTLILRIFDTDQCSSEDEVEQRKGEANAVHLEHMVKLRRT